MLSQHEEKITTKIAKSRHIVAPLFSTVTEAIAINQILEATLPSTLSQTALPAVTGWSLGAGGFFLKYHFTTGLILKPGITMVSKVPTEKQSLSFETQGKSALVLLSSIASGLVDAYKKYKLTLELGPHLAMAFATETFFLQQVAHLQGMGQTWMGIDNVNINDTWGGRKGKIFTLDVELITQYVIDIKSLSAKLYPAIEAALQYASVINFGRLIGYADPCVLSILGFLAAYRQYIIHKGFTQQIIKFHLALEKRKHVGLSWIIDSLVNICANLIDLVISLPGDLLAALFSPSYVIKPLSSLVGGINGYSFFKKTMDPPPTFLTNLIGDVPAWGYGIAGAVIDNVAEYSKHKAAETQKVTIIKSIEQDQKITHITNIKSIGINRIMEKKLGKADPDAGIISGIVRRFGCYANYLALKTVGLFNACRRNRPHTASEKTPLTTPITLKVVSPK